MSGVLWAALMCREKDRPKERDPAGEATSQRKCLLLPKGAENIGRSREEDRSGWTLLWPPKSPTLPTPPTHTHTHTHIHTHKYTHTLAYTFFPHTQGSAHG